MITEKADIQPELDRVADALAAMASGDPQPYKECWAESEDATLFGAWGPIEKGPDAVAQTFDWVGERFTGGTLEPSYDVVEVSGDLAYTVGLERGDVSVAGGPARPMTLRVTHVYRRIDGEWRLVHRHADFPPTDRRPRSRLSPAR
jgi:ketosteroid isomerase-like protein